MRLIIVKGFRISERKTWIPNLRKGKFSSSHMKEMTPGEKF